MSELLTQCPHCLTSFRVSEAQIEAAEGLVRCGSCLGLFSASLNLIRIKPLFHPEDDSDEEDDDSDNLSGDDEVSLGDMDLDAVLDFEDEEEDEDALDGDEDLDEDDGPVESSKESWKPYEEYQENADLFANLAPDEMQEDSAADAVLEEADEVKNDDDEFDDDFDDDYEYDEDEDEDDIAQTEDEFDSAGLMDLEDEELEYEYSRIVVLDEEFGTAAEDPLASDDQDEEQVLPEPERRGREKARLRAFLSGLRDDEGLEPLTDADLDPLDDDPLTFDAAGRQRRQLQQVGLGVLAGLLLVGLLLQFVNYHLDGLSQRNSFARFMPLVCRILECPAPEVASTLGSLYSQELLVRTHPRTADALEVSFIFRNDGADPQPFPGLELSFRSINNELLANRLFRPEEYLPPELRPLGLMPAASSVQIRLELLDPGAEAVNYTMAFREL